MSDWLAIMAVVGTLALSVCGIGCVLFAFAMGGEDMSEICYCRRCDENRPTFEDFMSNRPVVCCRYCGQRIWEGPVLPDELRARLLSPGEEVGGDRFVDAGRVMSAGAVSWALPLATGRTPLRG